MGRDVADWRRLRFLLGLLLIFGFCLYLPTLFHGVFTDDHVYLAYANRFLRQGDWRELHRFFVQPQNPVEFLPLRDLGYWLDFRIYGDEPAGFHATNLVWYGVSALAVFSLLRELSLFCRPDWADRATVLSLSGTVLFVVHPAHVEAVAWIASRKDLMAGAFGMLSIAALTRSIGSEWPWSRLLLSAALLLMACFSKASAMTHVVMATLLIGVGWRLSPASSRFRMASSLLVLWMITVLVFLIHWQAGETSGIRIENHPGAWAVIDRASRILTALIGILLLPLQLRFYYDVFLFGSWHWLVSASALTLFIVSLGVLSRKRSLWAFGIVLLFSPLLVYLQFSPFTTWSLASERFVFVSVAGLSLVMVDLFGRIGRPRMIIVSLLLLVAPCSALVWARVADWGEGSTLLSREYDLQPSFHNAIRDRIVLTLLPEQRYEQAYALAREIPAPYVADALVKLVTAERIDRQVRGAAAQLSEEANHEAQQRKCEAVSALRTAVSLFRQKIAIEPDVSYNNILRTLDRELEFRYAESSSAACLEGGVTRE